MHDFSAAADRILQPSKIHRLADVLTAPRERGIYAWLFTPGVLPVPDAQYEATDGFELMYVGIAPRRPSARGKESNSRLRNRLNSHAKKDASRSTLRMTLGV